MKTYVVAYDFENSAEKYERIFKELQQSPAWWHYLKNTWLIRTEKNAEQIFDSIKPYLDDEINVLIIEVGQERNGWLPEKSWEWLDEHVPRNRFNTVT